MAQFHTSITGEETYGEKTTYHAPYEKCKRVGDYRRAIKHFESIFTTERINT